MEQQRENDRPLGPVEFMNGALAAVAVGLVIFAGGFLVSCVFSLEQVAK